MKKKYEAPCAEVAVFQPTDILTVSGNEGEWDIPEEENI